MRPSEIQIEKVSQFSGHRSAVYCIAMNADNSGFYTGAGDGIIAEWKFNDPAHAKGIAQVPGNIFSLVHLPSMKLIIAGDMNGGIYVIDLANNTAVKNLSQNTASIYDLYADEAANLLYAACGDGAVRIFDLRDFTLIRSAVFTDKSIRNIAVQPGRKAFALSSSDHRIYVTDHDLELKYVLKGHLNSVFCSAFNNGGNLLVSGSRDAQLQVWDANDNYRLLQRLQAHMYTINDIKFSPGNRIFATAGRDKHIKIWDAESFNLLKVIDFEKYGGHINSVNKLFWSPSDNYLISCGDDRTAMLWKIGIQETIDES